LQAIADNSQRSLPPASAASARTSEHLYTLDLLRAIAALVVAVVHWDHFAGSNFPENAGAEPPWFHALHFVYLGGRQAVQLFFTLSGFVFYWLYSEKIAGDRINGWTFARLRFSRLYPLHLVTLIFVALAQAFIVRRIGRPFIFDNNGGLNFLEHLFLVSDWGPGRNFSFNGPIWSVSVEIFLYALFFIVCRLNLRRWWHLIGFSLTGLLLSYFNLINLGSGVFCFFLGGISYYIFRDSKRRLGENGLNLLTLGAVCAWFLVPYLNEHNSLYAAFKNLFEGRLHIGGKDIIGALLLTVTAFSTVGFLFPLTVLALAANDDRWKRFTRHISFLGNISYSSYLLHFPLQLVFLIATLALGLDLKILLARGTFLLFFALLIPISLVSYYKFEKPIQNFLRQRPIKPRA
jgi:peptidoglycan/LPS O-acetylase OafA/YrhL